MAYNEWFMSVSKGNLDVWALLRSFWRYDPWFSIWRFVSLLFSLSPGVFDVLAYTDKDLAVPFTWIESDPKLIANPQIVKLHSFDTKVREWGFFFCSAHFISIHCKYLTFKWVAIADSQSGHPCFLQEWWLRWRVKKTNLLLVCSGSSSNPIASKATLWIFYSHFRIVM